jgi:hypothetical protein
MRKDAPSMPIFADQVDESWTAEQVKYGDDFEVNLDDDQRIERWVMRQFHLISDVQSRHHHPHLKNVGLKK